jgi:hypothetical protein
MIERRVGAHAHEFLRADLDYRNPGIIVKVRNDMIGHSIHLGQQQRQTQINGRGRVEMPRTILAGAVDS